MGGSPCEFHFALALSNLLGNPLPMDGRVPRPGGRQVKQGTIFDQSPLEKAFSRWQQSDFHEVERIVAAEWRQQLKDLDLGQIRKIFQSLGIEITGWKSLADAKAIADAIVTGTSKPYERLNLAIQFFQIPQQFHSPIIEAWKLAGQPPLAKFAPYAAYALTLEIFFQVAVAAGQISSERPSNRMDIAYLFYLPFCMVFVSSDKLHARCAPLFLRSDQEFVWGPTLKESLRHTNEHFLALPEAQREKGVMGWSAHPPNDSFLTTMWERHMRPGVLETESDVELDPKEQEELVKRLNAFHEQTGTQADDGDEDDMLSIERRVRNRRGSWLQVGKDIPTKS
jgi:hypothetical protein